MALPGRMTPLIARIRDFFLQRTYNETHRFEKLTYGPRDQPPPNIPHGISHKLSANDYCLRDGRRLSQAPQSVYEAGQARLTSGEGSVAQQRAPRPGFGYSLETGKGL